MDAAAAKRLRDPFPPEAIGQLPKGGTMLDYVGHAAVTDRLLQVDPDWTWEPAGTTEHGLPMFDGADGLWIRLTVAGVTRYGYGDGKNPKECISDAIRNAAMRFGVALDLWSKEDLHTSAVVGGGQTSTADAPSAGEVTGAVDATPADTVGVGGVTGKGSSGPDTHEAEWAPSPTLSKFEMCVVPGCTEHQPRRKQAVSA